MGQGMSTGTTNFNSDFQSAIQYNGVKYQEKLISTATNMASEFSLPTMIDNSNKDDVITYILILQAMPMNKILNAKLTGFQFNAAKSNQFKQENSSGVWQIMQNITKNPADISGDDAYKNALLKTVTQGQYEDLDTTVAPQNSWMISQQDQGYGEKVSLGVQMFKCLATWFNKLDDIQNQYLSYLTNTPNPSGSYINTIISQADAVARQYQNDFNDLTQGDVAGVYVVAMGDSVQTITMSNKDKKQDIKMLLKFNYKNMISAAQFNNGKDLSLAEFSTQKVGGSGKDKDDIKNPLLKKVMQDGSTEADGTAWLLTDLGYYAYNISNKFAINKYYEQKLYDSEHYNKIWKFLYKGQVCVIVWSQTYLSNSQNGYHIIPVKVFQQLVSKQKASESFRPMKKFDTKIQRENFNSKIGQAMGQLNSETSDITQMLSSPRMQQFKKNIEQNKIDVKNIRAEGFTAIYE